MNFTNVGLTLDIIGVAILIYVSSATIGATTKTDKKHILPPYYDWIGYVFLALGFLFQIIGNIYK